MVLFRTSHTPLIVSLFFLALILLLNLGSSIVAANEQGEWVFDPNKYQEAEDFKKDLDQMFPEYTPVAEIKAWLEANGFEKKRENKRYGRKRKYRDIKTKEMKEIMAEKGRNEVARLYLVSTFSREIAEKNGNKTVWEVLIRDDLSGGLESLDALLLFKDEQFSLRKRPFRFENFLKEDVERTLLSLMDQDPTPEKIDTIMEDAGAVLRVEGFRDPGTRGSCLNEENSGCLVLYGYRYTDPTFEANWSSHKLYWGLYWYFDKNGKFIDLRID